MREPMELLPAPVVLTDQQVAAPLVTALAQELRLEEQHIRVIVRQLDRLQERGVLLRYEIAGISQMWKRAVWEDLGVPAEDVRTKRMTTGTTALFPPELAKPIDSMETRFRRLLDRHSFDVEGFRPFRYVLKGDGDPAHPETSAYWTLRTRHEELMAEWNARVDRLLEGYDDAVARLRTDYEEIARNEAWPALIARIRRKYKATWQAHAPRQDAFIDRIVARAEARLPSRELLRQTLQVRLVPGLLLNAADIERLLLERDQLQAQRDAVRETQLQGVAQLLMGMQEPEDLVLCEMPGRLYTTARAALRSTSGLGYLSTGTRETLMGLRTTYHLMSYTRAPAIEAALDQLEAALAQHATAQNGQRAPFLAQVQHACSAVIEATRPFVQRLAELRPQTWAAALREDEDEPHD